ncbi:hypothetical protein D3C81_1932270 [compost metagenome]
MACQLLPADIVLRCQGMVDRANRDHFDAAKRLAFERRGHLFVMKQQAQVRAALHQLARHVALGTAGQLDFH